MVETDNGFGLNSITDAQKNFFSGFLSSSLTGLISSGRGLEDLDLQHRDKYYLYTGRGPSGGSFHIGHIPSYQLTLRLQSTFNSQKIFFMLSDDEKVFRGDVTREQVRENVVSTLKQLKLLGFNESNTHFHLNSDGLSREHYEIVTRLLQLVNVNQLQNLFGEKTNLGEYFYPLVQLMPCFLDRNRQCVVVAGRDQDPFFRLARDLARRIGFKPPIVIYTKTLPGLDGSDKMSTSVPNSIPIFLTDTEKGVESKVKKIRHVGVGTLDELFESGANLKIDVPYQISLFFETDSDITKLIEESYTVGLTSESRVLELKNLVNEKAVTTRNGKSMLNSYGIRVYLTKLLNQTLQNINKTAESN